MIRSHNHSSYPRVAESPLDQQVRSILRARERGTATDGQVRDVEDEVTTVVVAEQSRAFIDLVTDGMVRWPGPLSMLARHLEGLGVRGLVRWFDTNFHDFRVVVRGEIRRNAAFLLHDYEVALGIAQKPLKVVLPGPVTFSRLARDEHYGDRGQVASAVADALHDEVAALVAAGARHFQIDEPALCRHPADFDLVVRCAGRVFEAAGTDAMTILGTCFGDLTAVGDRLGELPGTHLGLDMTCGDANWDLLDRLPPGRGVVLGVFDARTSKQEDAADVANRLEPHRDALTGRDVIVGPNSGLELLPRDQAFDKLLHARYLVEKLAEEWEWAS